jgi:hypothetical protein
MLTNVELFVQSVFLKLLEGKIKFHFASSILNYIENPNNDSFLMIARFSRDSFALIENDLENITPELKNLEKEHKGFKNAIHTIVSMVLSEYTYTFTDRNGNLVQSNLLFLLTRQLNDLCLKNLFTYLCEREMWEAFSIPQIYSSAFIFSSIIHKLLEKGLDDLALKCAMHFDNKSLLFVKDVEGLTPLDVATQKGCHLSAEYFSKLKQIGDMAGIFSMN